MTMCMMHMREHFSFIADDKESQEVTGHISMQVILVHNGKSI
jgi:hypothetical protein